VNKIWAAHLALLIANLIYGANYSIAKDVMPAYISPFGFIFLRVGCAAILFFLSSLLVKNRKIERADHLKLLICAFFGVALNQMLFFYGLSLTKPINAALMMVCTPILVLLISVAAGREKMGAIKLTGVLMGLLGALLIIVKPGSLDIFGGETITGDLCVLLNAISWGLYLVMVKPLMMKYNALVIIRWVFFYGFFLVLPFGYQQFLEINWSSFPEIIVWETAFVVFATTFVAYLLNTLALKWASPSLVSAYIYLQPFLAAAFALAAGKDAITTLKIISAVMIFTGVYLAGYKPKSTVENH
jgi:drug/metabolite transporter (DMT)-like permease